jgi:precorrin-4/cobalt-precorrin-4 C11-methyltransferase
LAHYPSHTKVAICFRLGWPDEQIWIVPLADMAKTTRENQLKRTTLYMISPALETAGSGRSRLYSPDHQRLFRSVKDTTTADSSL